MAKQSKNIASRPVIASELTREDMFQFCILSDDIPEPTKKHTVIDGDFYKTSDVNRVLKALNVGIIKKDVMI